MAGLDDDEAFARQLQREFDMESKLEEQDLELARALAASHDISDSDSETDERLPLKTLDSFKSEHTISESDSDATFIEEEDEILNSNDNHPTTRSSKRKRESDSDCEAACVEKVGETSRRGANSKLCEKKALVSSATKRLKKNDTIILCDEGTASSGSPSKPECPHGAKCYRKNPSHLEEFYHPGKVQQKSKNAGSDSSAQKVPLSCPEIVDRASPYGFILTRVSGINPIYNNQCAVHIRDILHPCMGRLVASAHFNYMFDIPWLMNQYPKQFRDKPLILVHGEQREGKMALHEAAHPHPNIKLCQAKLEMMFGTHHSKMMFLLYPDGMRVVIHTANIIEMDWHQKTQGIWISPLFPKLSSSSSSKSSATDGESPAFFKRDLLAYLTAYRSPALNEWKDHIAEHDMSGARVYIVASVPGRHLGESKDKWGHLKVRKILRQHGPEQQSVTGWPVIGQFSSIGSLGPDKNKWLCAEWFQSMSSVKGQSGSSISDINTKHMKLIFPCVDNVRLSLEGYPAGGSIPYSIQTAKKQLYLHSFFHHWKASTVGRDRASPHIKTYSRLSPDSKHISWFIVTSANLSKAAWGALEKNGTQLMIRSYEIGVMMLPKSFHVHRQTFPLSTSDADDASVLFRLPWDVPLTPYSKGDRPWIWDIPYTEKPDSHGNAWVPGRR